MHVTVLRMLSTSSLQAFSGATTTSPVGGAAAAARLVRGQSDATPSPRSAAPALPDARPGLPPPRGSLLNLSV